MTVSLFLGKEEVQMQKAQYGILRFAKYKGPEISNIEAHNERKKEKYASKQWNFYRSFSPQWRTFRHRFGNMIRRLVP